MQQWPGGRTDREQVVVTGAALALGGQQQRHPARQAYRRKRRDSVSTATVGRRFDGDRPIGPEAAAAARVDLGRCPRLGCDQFVGNGGHPAQRFVGRSGQLGLNVGQRTALSLAAFDRNDLQQVPRAIQRGAPLHDRPVDEPGGRVPPHRASIGKLADPAVGRSRVGGIGQPGGNPSHQLVQRPRRPLGHASILTLSRLHCQCLGVSDLEALRRRPTRSGRIRTDLRAWPVGAHRPRRNGSRARFGNPTANGSRLTQNRES
ncbi:conserved hypothetical protein [Mycobacterium marinum M]|uniref:Uncharacterized protein n=1 Tax=Mycobacterium marinum (strain ATCC BAA-535 / M) TaxID=216594 RepID=B2HK19_MYCMM|nr:conserved hypothetical protein [Mycobacterium marinum M]